MPPSEPSVLFFAQPALGHAHDPTMTVCDPALN